jgi:hypothetical protein
MKLRVMAGLDPAIHVLNPLLKKARMVATSAPLLQPGLAAFLTAGLRAKFPCKVSYEFP